MRLVEKQIMLQILDQRWKEHLALMDHLRQGIHLRAYAQKQPKQEYKRESFELFQDLLANIKRDVVRLLSRVQIEKPEAVAEAERKRREEAERRMRFSHAEASALQGDGGQAAGDVGGPPPAGSGQAGDLRAHGAQGGPQRTLPLRLRQEVQALSRTSRLMAVNVPSLGELRPVAGVRLGTARRGSKSSLAADRNDLVVMLLDPGTAVAGVFTRNAFRAAPVLIAEEGISAGGVRALVINSGNANAATGEPGLADARAVCASLPAASTLPEAAAVLPFSTGVIGVRLPVDRIVAALTWHVADAAADGWARAARAIMTTDTVPKAVSRPVTVAACR
jgi:hypothetical protein